jgi:hypothetical protein
MNIAEAVIAIAKGTVPNNLVNRDVLGKTG